MAIAQRHIQISYLLKYRCWFMLVTKHDSNKTPCFTSGNDKNGKRTICFKIATTAKTALFIAGKDFSKFICAVNESDPHVFVSDIAVQLFPEALKRNKVRFSSRHPPGAWWTSTSTLRSWELGHMKCILLRQCFCECCESLRRFTGLTSAGLNPKPLSHPDPTWPDRIERKPDPTHR